LTNSCGAADVVLVSARLSADLLDQRMPVETIQEAFDEFAQRGLIFLDGSLALALALPTVTGR